MSVRMLVFDVRDCEREIFESEEFQNFDIALYKECLNEETVKNIPSDDLENAMAISVFLDSEVTENVINSFKNLRIISTRSSSIEHINKAVAVNKNIDVVNVEGYSSKTAAQFTIGLMIALVRNLIPLSKAYQTGETIDFTGRDISQLTLGVIGTGMTGACVCKIAHALGMNVIAYDIVEKNELKNNTEINYVDLETLLKESDIITLHVPYTNESKNLITKKEFDMMKESAYLINTSKPKIVNMRDLYDALINKRIKGAALDIRLCNSVNTHCKQLQEKLNTKFECIEEAEIIKKLSLMSNVILTPQVAYKTDDVMKYILKTSITGIRDCIKGGTKFRAC